jgi:hypothetical protein
VNAINSLAKTIAALKTGAHSGNADANATQPGGSAKAPLSTTTPGADTESRLARLVVPLRAIDKTDPHRRKKALRLFVEAALLDEFGEELALAADFHQLVERVSSTIEANAEISSAATQALEALQQG